ncbi:unnamed protein product [Lathyrus sativus]|nr:unnamed protein product [Lathyrus sativus]
MASSNPTNIINDTNDHNTSCSNNNKLYKGVRKRKWGKWVSEIRLPNSRERIWLGSYDTQEKAARAFDAALYCLRGPQASFNFPNTPLTIINVGVAHINSLSPQEIQEIAARFANEYAPPPPIELSTTHEEEEDQQVPLLEGDLRRMDWTFEDMLDDMNGVANGSHFGYYGLEKMQYSSEIQYSNQLFEEETVDQIECEDSFSNHSLLWSWNF